MQIAFCREKEILKQIHFLAVLVYKATKGFPLCESKGLIAALRQCSLAAGAFLSDALRKGNKIYLVEALKAVQRHISVLRRELFTAHMLTYFSRADYESLDQQALLVQEAILNWQDSFEDEGTVHIKPVSSTAEINSPR